jgi:mono/diheme cytochrome c family protein
VTARVPAGVLTGLAVVAGLICVNAAHPSAAGQSRPGYDASFIGEPLSDPVMQHAKETYVLYGCAYCHGVTLIARGEAADLMHSALVGADVNGNIIVPLLKTGIPQTAKLSPMPQFSDLSDQQLHEIASYIHYARGEGRYKEVIGAPLVAGDAAAGKVFFDSNCTACHAKDLVGIGRKYDQVKLRQEVIDPSSLKAPVSFKISDRHDTAASTARERHHALLENYTPVQVANLLAYLNAR